MNYVLWLVSNAIVPIATFFVLFATLVIIWVYTCETKKLRKVAQKQIQNIQEQTELQLMPFVLLHNQQSHTDIYLRNVGNGTATNIKIKKEKTGEPFIPNSNSIASVKLPPRFLSKGENRHFFNSMEQTIMREVYLIEFENINRKRYFVREEYKADDHAISMTTFEILEFGPVI